MGGRGSGQWVTLLAGHKELTDQAADHLRQRGRGEGNALSWLLAGSSRGRRRPQVDGGPPGTRGRLGRGGVGGEGGPGEDHPGLRRRRRRRRGGIGLGGGG